MRLREIGFYLPMIKKVANKYLCVAVTSTPSERLFSPPRSSITSKRNMLNPVFAEKLIFLHKSVSHPSSSDCDYTTLNFDLIALVT